MARDSSIPLDELQAWMQNMIVRSDADPDGDSNLLDELVASSDRLSASEHLGIYRRSYIARLRACMSAQFSALEYALGATLFEGFVDEYLESHPSTSSTLADLGSQFAAFLEQTRPDSGLEEREDWPDFMIDLITFEFDINRAFDQISDTKYRLADSQTPDSQLRLLPVCYLHSFRFPVCWYYRAFKSDQVPELPIPFATFCAITRHDYRIGLMDVSAPQYHFLSALQRGAAFDEARAGVLATQIFDEETWGSIWPRWKRDWIDGGLLCEFEFEEI